MTTPSVDRAALHQFVTGSSQLGSYPSTQWSAWDSWRRQLLAETKARGISVHLTGSTTAPTHAPVPTLLSDVAAQCGEAWPDTTRTDGMTWTLEQAIEQVRLCALALDVADNPAPSGGGGTTPTPSGAWPPTDAVFYSRWDAGDIHDGGKFASADWDFQSTTPTIVASPVRSGGKALRVGFGANGAQSPAAGASPSDYARRAEMEPASVNNVQSGDTWWVRYDVLLEAGFPIGTSDWCVIGQFKQGPSGSPPEELVVVNGRWKVIRQGTSSNPLGSVDLGPAVTGKVQRVVWGVTFGDSTHGKVGGSVDGVRVADVTASTWNNQGTLYLKCPGIYADNTLSGAMGAVFDNVVVGKTYDSVA